MPILFTNQYKSEAFEMTSHTMFRGGVPDGYFSIENIKYVQKMVTANLHRTFKQNITYTVEDTIKIMQRVLDERREDISRMNIRAIMYMCDEFKAYQDERNRNMNWEENFYQSQQLYDNVAKNAKVDPCTIKLSNHLGRPDAGGSQRFYFT